MKNVIRRSEKQPVEGHRGNDEKVVFEDKDSTSACSDGDDDFDGELYDEARLVAEVVSKGKQQGAESELERATTQNIEDTGLDVSRMTSASASDWNWGVVSRTLASSSSAAAATSTSVAGSVTASTATPMKKNSAVASSSSSGSDRDGRRPGVLIVPGNEDTSSSAGKARREGVEDDQEEEEEDNDGPPSFPYPIPQLHLSTPTRRQPNRQVPLGPQNGQGGAGGGNQSSTSSSSLSIPGTDDLPTDLESVRIQDDDYSTLGGEFSTATGAAEEVSSTQESLRSNNRPRSERRRQRSRRTSSTGGGRSTARSTASSSSTASSGSGGTAADSTRTQLVVAYATAIAFGVLLLYLLQSQVRLQKQLVLQGDMLEQSTYKKELDAEQRQFLEEWHKRKAEKEEQERETILQAEREHLKDEHFKSMQELEKQKLELEKEKRDFETKLKKTQEEVERKRKRTEFQSPRPSSGRSTTKGSDKTEDDAFEWFSTGSKARLVDNCWLKADIRLGQCADEARQNAGDRLKRWSKHVWQAKEQFEEDFSDFGKKAHRAAKAAAKTARKAAQKMADSIEDQIVQGHGDGGRNGNSKDKSTSANSPAEEKGKGMNFQQVAASVLSSVAFASLAAILANTNLNSSDEL